MRLAEDGVGSRKHLVQTQVVGQQGFPAIPVFSKRFSTPSDFRRATVVDSVAVPRQKAIRVQIATVMKR
jgi:hypothetical protein